MENKAYCSAYIKELDEEDRTLVAIASSGKIDRDYEVSRTSGWVLDEYQKHPIILLSHNSRELWVGKTLWIKKTKEGLIFKMQFATTAAAREAFQLVKDTGLCAFSVGFQVVEFKDMTVSELEPHEKEGSKLKATDKVRVLTKMKLFEISICSLPCDSNALLKYNYEPTEIVKQGMSGNLAKYKSLSETYKNINFNDYIGKSGEENISEAEELDGFDEKTINAKARDEMTDLLLEQMSNKDARITELELQLKERQKDKIKIVCRNDKMKFTEKDIDRHLAERDEKLLKRLEEGLGKTINRAKGKVY